MTGKNRWNLTWLLLVLMSILIFALPVSASAAGRAAARIGKKNYSTLDAAISSVKKNQTIVLLRNVSENQVYCNNNVTFKLDLNKHTLKTSILMDSGNMTIENGTLKVPESDKKIMNIWGGKVTINGGTYIGMIHVQEEASLVINKGAFKAVTSQNDAKAKIGTANILNLGTTTIRNGKFTTEGKFGKNIGNNGKLVIYDGSFISDQENIDTMGKAVIKKGTFVSKGKKFDEKYVSIRMLCCQSGTMTVDHVKVTANGNAYPVYIYYQGKYSLQGTTQGRYLTGGVPPVRFSM